MQQSLRRHPDSPCATVGGIAVQVSRSASDLMLRYAMTGKIGELRVPEAAAPGRTDGLWRHTCFEAFLRPPAGEAYYEFNFAPSLQWAAYRFNGYRSGMQVAEGFRGPCIEIESEASRLELRVALSLSELPELSAGAAWHLALSAVIEEADGALSYWALAHPPGRPDFHHSDCFALELRPA
jgi:hypothetical protein